MEARKYFAGNKNKYAFASNYFGKTAKARAFVEKLYQAGARQVVVQNIRSEPWRIKEEGGPYADILVVDTAGKASPELIRVMKSASPDEMSEQRPGVFRLWWD